MKALLRIARTEALEHTRQPWMLFILAANYALSTLLFGALFAALGPGSSLSGALEPSLRQLDASGLGRGAFVKAMAITLGTFNFTNLPVFVAMMSGTSVLHDRECGTMPFLMLAPVTRWQLVAGKLAGAMALPLLLHVVFVGPTSLLLGHLAVVAPYRHLFGGSPAWWVAFLFGAPASAAFVGALGTVISARSRDMRTSMQFTSFFVGLLSLGIAYVLVDALSDGVALQAAFASGCAVAAALTLGVGARLISRDVAEL